MTNYVTIDGTDYWVREFLGWQPQMGVYAALACDADGKERTVVKDKTESYWRLLAPEQRRVW